MTKHDFSTLRRALVETLIEEGIIRTKIVKEAMLKVPREEFVPKHLRDYAYEDTPLPIGYGQTISAPHMVALMCEEAQLAPGMRVLEIGTGSGYHAAVIAEIVGPRGAVYTIERLAELTAFARKNLAKTGYLDRITLIVGDGSMGYPPAAPYDRIIVTAAAPEVPPPLVSQLAVEGIMVIPIGDRFNQVLYVVRKKSSGDIEYRTVTPCLFVPLIGKHGWNG
ncbi:MAG TPA: protein-L-isoaspartate(D-aspartate) O-methyltransferase [Pyrodictiaceae archaeon]|nr:protein-L-isoaspartate(D-aspartate) O-methyltransferase [Pyrodictiaceae archaeon]HIP85869.1 protein-L-isoaspartate(D-aspartate) O-methyltransferase [Pyrodictium sp.]HIQ10636.1 protein-L-isoaspartate(D-aspartate) O-methyltransferase [Pyrodictium sp.]